MKQIEESPNEHRWPRQRVDAVPCRKRDLIIRITDWWDENEATYDVEVYIGGVYDYNESKSFTAYSGLSKAQAKKAASKFAASKISSLL